MGLFDFFKRKTETSVPETKKSTISESEKKFYQDDSYYTKQSHKGTAFEHDVVTFEERKKTAVPTRTGLYPAQVLLLEYCSYGTYPEPKNGYPGFWWFEYGIRDVGSALKELEQKRYIALGSINDSVKQLTIPELKQILEGHGQKTTGKKDELIARVQETASEEEIKEAGVIQKYQLTELGRQELEENAYVPYMHKHPLKTTEDTRFGTGFNVWSINKLLGTGDKSNWRAVVDTQEQKIKKETDAANESFMKQLKTVDPAGYRELKKQDQQIEACQNAKAKYEKDQDLESYIRFWEQLWKNGGLVFEGAGWHFVLADLYIKAKRYKDARDFVTMIKKKKPAYANKAHYYEEKIEKLLK